MCTGLQLYQGDATAAFHRNPRAAAHETELPSKSAVSSKAARPRPGAAIYEAFDKGTMVVQAGIVERNSEG
jgi:hypothetical protein